MRVVVHLTASKFFGAPERQMLGLALGLRQTYRSVFVSFAEAGGCRVFLAEAQKQGFESFALENDTPRLLAALRELIALLRCVRADLVCCRGYKANLLGQLATRWLEIPVVAVSHGWTGESFRVRCYEAADRLGLRGMDRVVCVSEGQAAKVRRAHVSPQRLVVIRDAIQVERFAHPDPTYRELLRGFFPKPRGRIVGAAGRLSPEKGFGVLIEAAEIATQADPTLGFVLFGEGPLGQGLARQIARRGLTNTFVLAGFRADLDRFLPHLDLMVLPSFTEGLPNIVLESFAAGVPAVATAVGGTPELIVDGVNGYLVPPGDPRLLAQRIVAALQSESQRQAMGLRGRQRVEEHFTFEVQSAHYQRLFDSLMHEARTTSARVTSPLSQRQVPGRLAPTVPAARQDLSPSRVFSATPKRLARPLRVCFLIDRLCAAGTELQLIELIRHLDRSRVKPFLCLLDGEDPLSRSLEPDDCPVQRLGVRSLHHARTLFQSLRFGQFLRQERIDVLQVHFQDSTYLGVLIARLAGVPKVVRTRRDLGYWMTPIHRVLGRLYNRLVDATLTNCEACRQALLGAEGPAPASVVVLENGVDLSRFANLPDLARANGCRRPPRVGMVANLRPQKNLELFLRAAKIVTSAHPDVTFQVAGEGPSRPELERLIDDLGLGNRFTLRGAVADIPAFLSGLDIAVLCSRTEGQSNALLEYMAAGRAIVATAVGGNVELIEDGVHGLLVPSDDPLRLVAAIDRLLRDRVLAVRLGANARRRLKERFSFEAQARRAEAFYQALVSRRDFAEGPGADERPPSPKATLRKTAKQAPLRVQERSGAELAGGLQTE